MESAAQFADRLAGFIAERYDTLGYGQGWRLLYSPPEVLDDAQVAYIALNPGGTGEGSEGHYDRYMPAGQSAYVDERWPSSRLQRQARLAFDEMGLQPHEVLAGNVIPFRSQDIKRLQNRREALGVGVRVWKQIFNRNTPPTVITLGRDAQRAIASLLGSSHRRTVPTGWDGYPAEEWTFDGGRQIYLPHPSRFPVLGRQQSTPELVKLLRNR